ncbi:MAG: OmpA family protein [Desulfobacterales bacterium]|nr:OmpA family protein [Desulfobacterales bacterium]
MKTCISKIWIHTLWMVLGIQFLFAGVALAKEVKEHPMIRPFPGSVLAENMSKYQKFNVYEFYYMNKQTNKREKKKVSGEYYYLLYEVRTSSGSRVQDMANVEFFENYKAAAIEKGGETVFEDRDQLVFTIPRDDGGRSWCRVTLNAGMGQQYLVIIDEKGLETSMTFGPKELKEALDKDGKVLLYGILFDLDEATLKIESVKQLQHMVSLMITYPELNIEIQGHTDNQGADTYNMELSQKRAQTVCAYLELFGILPDRLLAVGYGETRPVAGNDTEEGRAKNRRVELVKMTAGQKQAAMVNAEEKNKASTLQSTPVSSAISGNLEGKWNMTPNKRVKSGTITFYSNGTYLMEERLQDGDGVSRKGEFKVNNQTSPNRIDICLGKCGASGAEYTTGFSIFRFFEGGKLEICSSPDGKYPVRFNDGIVDEYTMILTRIE